jgi:hypothetical protein
MKTAAALGAAILIATSAFAAIERAANDSWMARDHLMIIDGKVVSVTLVDPRTVPDLPIAGSENWLFPHARARFAVFRVLQNRTGTALAAGDTVTALFVADNMTANVDYTTDAGDEGIVHIVNDFFPRNELIVGVRGAFLLHMSNGEMWCSPSWWDLPRVVEALEKYGDGRVGGEDVERTR